MRHVMKQSSECHVPEEGRKVNLWGLVVEPKEFFDDVQGVALSFDPEALDGRAVKDYLETAMESHRDVLVGIRRHGRAEETGPTTATATTSASTSTRRSDASSG